MNIPFPRYIPETPVQEAPERETPNPVELEKTRAKNTPKQKITFTAAPTDKPADKHWEKRYTLLTSGQLLSALLLCLSGLLIVGGLGVLITALTGHLNIVNGVSVSCLALALSSGLLNLNQQLIHALDSLQNRV